MLMNIREIIHNYENNRDATEILYSKFYTRRIRATFGAIVFENIKMKLNIQS